MTDVNHLAEAIKIFDLASEAGEVSGMSYGDYAKLAGMIAIAEQLEIMNAKPEAPTYYCEGGCQREVDNEFGWCDNCRPF